MENNIDQKNIFGKNKVSIDSITQIFTHERKQGFQELNRKELASL